MNELKQKATEIRKEILKTVHHAGAGHIGGPMSAVDVLTYLYFNEMNINPEDGWNEHRDRFVLSKGHSAIGLYATLAVRGYMLKEELNTFDAVDSRLQGHPDMTLLPGLDMSTGSLGQGLSAALGIALGAKLQNKSYRAFCMIGDGESQEGQIWEAADVASKYGVDNLVCIVDNNKLQQFGWSDDQVKRNAPLEDPSARWAAFGWHVISIDGHNFEEIEKAFKEAAEIKGKPTVIISNTIKGKGVSFMEGAYLWHSRVPTDEELQAALEELDKEAVQ
ncbi:transketolase [Lysinibacillus sp. NPDC098008]|uniref:transketolase n=1 Tax=Lysinibacillus sp. NPDC098008 TaxID=3364146 RepID=UPI00381E7E25